MGGDLGHSLEVRQNMQSHQQHRPACHVPNRPSTGPPPSPLLPFRVSIIKAHLSLLLTPSPGPMLRERTSTGLLQCVKRERHVPLLRKSLLRVRDRLVAQQASP